jgi:hypothetical protein
MFSYLVSYDPGTRQRVDYGVLVDKSGGKILGTQGAACGPDGMLYFFGAVEQAAAKPAGGKSQAKAPFALKLIIVDPSRLKPEAEGGKAQ